MNYSRHLYSAFVLVVIALSCANGRAAETQQNGFVRDVEQRVVALTNDLRKRERLQPLQTESRLSDAARDFAGYIAKTDQLEHDADGSTPGDRAKKRGYSACMIAENLAFEYNWVGFTPERLAHNFVQGWNESATHRANMLQPDVTQIGIGIVPGRKEGEFYAVQLLGRPMSQMVRFRVTNRTADTIRYDFRRRTIALAPKQTRTHESCVSGDLRFEWPGKQQAASVHAKDGGRYALVDGGRGVYRVVEE